MPRITFALLLAVLLSACASQPAAVGAGANHSKEAQAPSNALTVSDLPIPTDAKLDDQQTFIIGSGEKWLGRIAMTGGISPVEAVNFYQSRMGSFGWTGIAAVQAKVSTLTFTRNDRVATVQIEPDTFKGCHITVTVTPRQGVEPVSAAKH